MSSEPRRTFLPATNLVPRWRIIILPILAGWPAKSLTPRYCGCESRPSFVDPAALVCAITSMLSFPRRRESRICHPELVSGSGFRVKHGMTQNEFLLYNPIITPSICQSLIYSQQGTGLSAIRPIWPLLSVLFW